MKEKDYASLILRLEELQKEPAFDPVWTLEMRPICFLPAIEIALGQKSAADYRMVTESARSQIAMLERPIIAVIGQLVSGKSSVTATFLSADGRRRVPRGVEGSKGTHRFVYWVPVSWLEKKSVREAFLDLLASVHGPQYELLSTVQEEAENQYRSGRDDPSKLTIPLVAGDTELEKTGVAILDCPDVQTRDKDTDLRSENPRIAMLACTAQICSGVLVVWTRSAVRDGLLERMLSDVRGSLPTTPVYLLLNKIDPEKGQPTRTRTDPDVIALLDGRAIAEDEVYGAFHYRIERQGEEPGWRDMTPPRLVENFTPHDPLPQFFSISSESEKNEPGSVSEDRFLVNLPPRLQTAELQRGKMAGTWTSLVEKTRHVIQQIRVHFQSQEVRAGEMQEGLLNYCVDLMRDQNTKEPRQLLTKEFTEAFHTSLQDTAPEWVKFSMLAAEPFNWLAAKIKGAASEFAAIVKVLRNLPTLQLSPQELFAKVKEALSKDLGLQDHPDAVNIFDSATLSETMKTLRWVPADITEEQLAKGWSAVLKAMKRFPLTPDPEEMTQMTSEIWQALGFWDKLGFAAKNFLAAVGTLTMVSASLLIMIDMGATFMLTTWLAGILHTKALLIVVLASGIPLGVSMMQRAVKLNSLPWLARIYALAADVFGIPRRFGSSPLRVTFKINNEWHCYDLPNDHVPAQECVCRLETLKLFQPTSTISNLEKLLNE